MACIFFANSMLQLQAFSDANWTMDSQSTTKYCF